MIATTTINTPPTIIISLPRSGSSLTSGIFAQHGAWTGTCKEGDSHNPKGYFENLKVKNFMISNFGRIVHQGKPAETNKISKEKFEKVILEDGYPNDGTPWVVKFSAMYFPPWIEAFPDANVVCVRRDIASIQKSGKSSKMLKKDEPIQPHIDMMDLAVENHNAINVHYENLIVRNYFEIEGALKRSNITPNQQIIDDFVEPSYRNF